MLVTDSQCAARVTEFQSHSVETALSVVQGIVTLLSIIGSVLLILSYMLLRPIRTKSRLLIAHLAAANFLQAFPNFLAVFMNFRARFRLDTPVTQDVNLLLPVNVTNVTEALACNGASKLLDHSGSIYCNLCVYQGFISLIGALATIFWTVCVCVHYFILVSYRNTKLASQVAYIYYVIAWLAPLGICLWLLLHNWLGFEPTYSTVNCGIRADCIPHHHPYHYKSGHDHTNNWNRAIGLLFGLKIWQLLAFLIIPCLFVAIQCKNRKHQIRYKLLSSAPVRDVERKLLLIPMIFMLISTVCFVSDLYFFTNHNKNLKNLQKNNSSIVFVHFLIRIFDNSQGVINFCLFCLSAREVRWATANALNQLCHRLSTNRTTHAPMPEVRKFTVVTPNTGSTSRYGAVDSMNQ